MTVLWNIDKKYEIIIFCSAYGFNIHSYIIFLCRISTHLNTLHIWELVFFSGTYTEQGFEIIKILLSPALNFSWDFECSLACQVDRQDEFGRQIVLTRPFRLGWWQEKIK